MRTELPSPAVKQANVFFDMAAGEGDEVDHRIEALVAQDPVGGGLFANIALSDTTPAGTSPPRLNLG